MKYELWKKDNLSGRHGQPESTYYTLDSAMLNARFLSKGITIKSVYNATKKVPGQRYDGGYDDVQVPNSLAVIERSDKQSIVRGYGIGGCWYDARDCKRCKNTGEDANNWGLTCASCKGSSFKPKV